MAFATNAQDLSSSKETMIKAVKSWAASQTDLKEDDIKVRALDRRLQVPTCPSNFDVSFPYKTSQQTVPIPGTQAKKKPLKTRTWTGAIFPNPGTQAKKTWGMTMWLNMSTSTNCCSPHLRNITTPNPIVAPANW